MEKQAGKKLTFSTETLRALTSSDELGLVAGGLTTAVSCGCTTTAVICRPTLQCTTG
jgi:hypothetical protein